LAVFERLAPAKVNLFLHVGPLGGDGYHPICSLMTFADLGDVVALDLDGPMAFRVTGPYAAHIADGETNLVVRARDAVMAAFDLHDAFTLTLDKRLPIAAGLGGGSSDAAATLMLMQEALNLTWDDDDGEPVRDIARALGADVPACLEALPVVARGRGDELAWPPLFPDLDVVLANPGVLSPTAAVYHAYDDQGASGGADAPAFPETLATPEETAAWLARLRNDLEPPAVSLAPQIGQALALLREQPETLLARMSGSGATCFAICRTRRAAEDLALRLRSAQPHWWVQACRLQGFRP
jgi:4-diphosphocytidyl-2-C-methyl-D-erythritol kinase